MMTSSNDYLKELAIDVLARTIWGEARGEGEKGMEAVAAIILNRLSIAQKKGHHWWGNDIISICQKPFQFSVWNKNDPNFKKVSTVDSANRDFITASRIARCAANGRLNDPTHGATHYHTKTVNPVWTRDQIPTIILGNHVFYKLTE